MADEVTLEYLYEPALEGRNSLMVDRIISHARRGEYDYAMQLSDELLERLRDRPSVSSTVYGKLLVNSGILYSASGQYEEGVNLIEAGIEMMERRVPQFSEELIPALIAKGISEFSLDDFEMAEDSYRRAQHITHRQGGVYAEGQLPIVDRLTAIHLKQGRILSADQQQRFSLRVAEQTYGPNSVELVPMLTRLGSYFSQRGSAYPVAIDATSTENRMVRSELFDDAFGYLDRAITIVEQNFGKNDTRLVEPLRTMARARLRQNTKNTLAEEALERSLDIVESNPDSDLTDRANAMIALGDLYIVTGDDRAAETYLVAWHLLQENEQTRQLSSTLFGTPVRVNPRQRPVRILHRQPDNTEPGDPLFVSLEYSVTTEGRVQSVRVIDKNVPNDKVRDMRDDIRRTRFRPRIKDGEIVATHGLVLYQPFQVDKRFNYVDDSLEDYRDDEEAVEDPVDDFEDPSSPEIN